MIGNPKHPIMSMGNMILDSCTIEHYGPLGLDDFPTGLKVTMTLKHGMPRDNLKIEQMYMNGDYRIYHALDDRTYDVWANAEEINPTPQYSTDKPENTQETAGYVFDSENETTEDADIKDALNKKRFLKYFGMDNKVGINTAGKEANFGANKRGSNKNSTGQISSTNSNKKSTGKTK
jgi:hypothetical protein